MQANKIMVVYFFEPIEIGKTFIKWPHHITLVPWFTCDNINSFTTSLTNLCYKFEEIDFEVGSDELFGKNKSIKCGLIIKNDLLMDLHNKIINIVLLLDPTFNTKFCGNDYTPHVSHKNSHHPKKGNTGKISSLYIIKAKEKMVREVISKHFLGVK